MNNLFITLESHQLSVIKTGDYILYNTDLMPYEIGVLSYVNGFITLYIVDMDKVIEIKEIKWMSKAIFRAFQFKDARIEEYQTTILNQYNMLNLIEAKLDEHITNKL